MATVHRRGSTGTSAALTSPLHPSSVTSNPTLNGFGFDPHKPTSAPSFPSELSSPGKSGGRRLRFNAGHLAALLLLVGGVGLVVVKETQRLYRESLASNGSIRGGFCAMPPRFEPSEDEVLGSVKRYRKFDLSIPMVGKYAKLIHGYLEPWYPIPGIQSGLGKQGFVTPQALEGLARQPAVMSCGAQIRVINGQVYFRYGGFWHVYYRLHRFLQTVKMIQDAIEQFDLDDLRLELFINTCDHPQSFYSGHWPDRAGYPIMSTGFTSDTMDIPIPDPLDLTKDYTPNLSTQIPWERKTPRAVFRGKTTNFAMFDGNWGANPRVRLHRMSDVERLQPLMDAHINSWSHATDKALKGMRRDGLREARRMNFTQFNAFKYQVIVDGGGGSCRTCGVLRSNQMSIRQHTPLLQFYEPLLHDGVHWLETTRTFSDLPGKIQWAMRHDADALGLVRNANDMAQYACTWRGRTLYWAIMLIKYQRAMQAPDLVDVPGSFCTNSVMLISPEPEAPSPANVRCDDPQADAKQPNECIFFCAGGEIPKDRIIWLPASVLNRLKRIGPP